MYTFPRPGPGPSPPPSPTGVCIILGKETATRKENPTSESWERRQRPGLGGLEQCSKPYVLLASEACKTASTERPCEHAV